MNFRRRYPSTVRLFPEFTFFWIPLLLTLVWLATEVWAARSRRAALAATGVVGAAEARTFPAAP
jgi:hypothetical protein